MITSIIGCLTHESLPLDQADRGAVGIPRVLNMYENFPFWAVFFREAALPCGAVSPQSTRQLYELGIEIHPQRIRMLSGQAGARTCDLAHQTGRKVHLLPLHPLWAQ
ncbi:MAG: acyl-CoA dehydratase activase-related protein [Enterocloster clostridioformis]